MSWPTPGQRIDWIRRNIVNPRTRQLIDLLPFQTQFIEETYKDGKVVGCLATPRKNGKSGLAAGLVLAELDLNDDADIILGATKLKQLQRSAGVMGVARTLIRLGGLDHFKVSRNNNDPTITNTDTGCKIEAMAFGDEEAAQGLNPSLILLDEFGTAFWTPERWAAVVMSMGGRGAEQRVIGMSTPHDQASAMFQLRRDVLQGKALPSFYWQEHSAPIDLDPYDEATWYLANPALGYFKDIEAIRKDVNSREVDFRRYQLGQFDVDANSLDGWLGHEGAQHWDATEKAVDFDLSEPVYVGCDLSKNNDYSAVVMVQRQGTDYVSRCWTFKPRPMTPGATPTIDHKAVKDTLRTINQDFKVQAIGYDSRFFVEGSAELLSEGLPMLEVYQTTKNMVPAFALLRTLILERRFFHEEDQDYREAMLSAVPRYYDDEGFMLSKNKSFTKIDPAVATGIAIAVMGPEPGELWWRF